MKRRLITLACVVLMALLICGCAARRAEEERLYSRLVEEPAGLDWSVLEARTIVIDPGHGGRYDGVIGIDSLREADANLGVALYLWGLLDEAGADVHLTRTTDRDFVSGDSLDLKEDLGARSERANSFRPEVFISIHHNSNISLDRDQNRVEVYYRATDPEASLELANDIHRHLARNLGIEESRVEPGSYFVLRNSKAHAAVLGEASYLSHPSVEERLKLSAKQKLEAEAYFLGLVSYFSRGVPVVRRIEPKRDTLLSHETLSFEVEQGAGVPIDPATALVRVGSHLCTPIYDQARSRFRCALDPDLPNGTYEISCSVRSIRGGTGSSGSHTILLARPARFVLPLPSKRLMGRTVSLRCKALDERGAPVADGTRLTISPVGSDAKHAARCRKGIATFEVDSALASSPMIITLPGMTDTLRFSPPDDGHVPLLVVDMGSGKGVDRLQAIDISQASPADPIRGDSDGLLRLPRDAEDASWLVSAPGFRPAVVSRSFGQIVRLSPLYGGILSGLGVMIDPAGGGRDEGGIGPGRSRGSAVNLETAKRIEQYLARCGARVRLTRRGEETVSLEERIFAVNRHGAGIAIRIDIAREAGGGCSVSHYPGSERGIAVARSISSALGGLPPCGDWAVMASSERFLQQTSCPAVTICNRSIADSDSEKIYSKHIYADLVAERALAGLIASLGADTVRIHTQRIRIQRGGMPVSGAAVSVDDLFSRSTDAEGIAEFTCLETGEHILTIELPDGLSPPIRRSISIRGGESTPIDIPVDR